MDIRRKVFIISEEMVETCFAINDHICTTALEGNCPRSTCSMAYEQSVMKALNDIKEKEAAE